MAASTNCVFALCFLVLAAGLSAASTIPPTPQDVQQQLLQEQQDPTQQQLLQDPTEEAEVKEALANAASNGGFGVVGVPAQPIDNGVTTSQAAPTASTPTTQAAPTTSAPTSSAPTTVAPTTPAPTTAAPTTQAAPTTLAPTTAAPTTQAAPTTLAPTTAAPTTQAAPVTTVAAVVAADTNAPIAADTTTSGSAPPTPGAPVNPSAVPFPLPPYDCYDCNSGSALPGFWRNKNCDASGYVAQWYIPRACNTYCFSSVGLYPAGAVYRGCASSLYLKGRPMQQGCFTDPDNDRYVCLCAGNNCNTHDLSALAETYADRYIAMQQSTTARSNGL